MSDAEEGKKKGFFGNIAGKLSDKVRGFNPNTIGWIILGLLGLVALFAFLAFVTSIFDGTWAWGNILTFVITIAALCAMAGMVHHMMETLKQELRLRADFDVNTFKELRVKAGKSESSSDAENSQAEELLGQVVDCWTDIENENGQEMHYPKNMKEVAKARRLLIQVVNIAPTKTSVVDTLSSYAAVVKEKTNRTFDGSGMLLGLSAVMAIGIIVLGLLTMADAGIMGFIAMLVVALLLWGVPCGMYFLACRTPGLMLEARKNKKPSRFKFVNAIIAIIFGVGVAGLKTDFTGGTVWYKVYSDGRKEYDAESNMMQLMFSLGIKAFIAFCVLMLLFFISLSVVLWAAVNYLRNYVIYK